MRFDILLAEKEGGRGGEGRERERGIALSGSRCVLYVMRFIQLLSNRKR